MYNEEELMLDSFGTLLLLLLLIVIAIGIIQIVASWKIFKKAGRNGWESIIPYYNNYVLYEIVGLKGWYAFLGLIPYVGSIIAVVFGIMANIKLASAFGKDTGYGIGLIFLPFIFYPMLAFGDSTYTGSQYNTNTNYNPNPEYNPNATANQTQVPTQPPVAAPNPMAQNKVHFEPPANNNNQNNTPGAI